MSDNELILSLFTLALLVGFLIERQWERSRRRRMEHPPGGRPHAHPIDVTPLRPRLHALRRDFSAAARDHARPVPARAGALARARRRLASLGFFRRQPAGDEMEHPAH